LNIQIQLVLFCVWFHETPTTIASLSIGLSIVWYLVSTVTTLQVPFSLSSLFPRRWWPRRFRSMVAPREPQSAKRLRIKHTIIPHHQTPWYISYLVITLVGLGMYGFIVFEGPETLWPITFPLFLSQTGVVGETMYAFPARTNAAPLSNEASAYWIFDSGAGRHMARDLKRFSNLVRIPTITIDGIGGSITSQYMGTFKGLAQSPEGVWKSIALHRVLYVPDLPVPALFSLPQAKGRGIYVDVNGPTPYIKAPNGNVIRLEESRQGYLGLHIYAAAPASASPNTTAFVGSLHSSIWTSCDVKQFHAKHGHLGLARLKLLAKSLRVHLTGELEKCQTCSATKVQRGAISRAPASRSDRFLERVYVDLAGPFPPSGGGNRYLMTIVDDYSRFSWVYFLPNRTHVGLVRHLNHFKQQHEEKISFLRTDNEFASTLLDAFCVDHGILHELTPPHTPEYNGVVERRIAVIKTMAMSFLVQSRLSLKLRAKYWAEAFNHANAMVNLAPTSGNLNNSSPAILADIHVREPSLTFGSIVYLLNPNPIQGQMDVKGDLGVYLGESTGPIRTHPKSTIRAFKVTTGVTISSANFEAHDGVFLMEIPHTSSPTLLTTASWFLPNVMSALSDDDVEYLSGVLPSDKGLQGAALCVPCPDQSAEHIVFTTRTPVVSTDQPAVPASVTEPTRTPVVSVTAPVRTEGEEEEEEEEEEFSVPAIATGTHASHVSEPAATVPLEASHRLADPVVFDIASIYNEEPKSIGSVEWTEWQRTSGTNAILPRASRSRGTAHEASMKRHAQGFITKHSSVSKSRVPIFLEGFSHDQPCLMSLDLPEDLHYDDLPNANDDPDSVRSTAAFLSAISNDVHCESSNVEALFRQVNDYVLPKRYEDVLKSRERTEWLTAMQSEMDAHGLNSTWSLVPLPRDRKAIGSRWIFALKLNPDGTVKRFKARLVAQGYTQKEGVDYTDTFAPVVGMTTVRLLISMAAASMWPIYQLDVETAFLQASVREDIYVSQAPGYKVTGPDGSVLVYKLIKSLYGLKQSPFNWNMAIHGFLIQYGWKRNAVDACMYTMRCSKTNCVMILTIYVDDILITGDWKDGIDAFKVALKSNFRIQDLGLLEHCLGFNIEYREDGILLNQHSYIAQLLLRFDMEGCFSQPTPAMRSNVVLPSGHSTTYPYRELVGSLLYIALVSRPDIANAVRMLTKRVNAFDSNDVAHAKRVLRYLSDTKHHGLCYGMSDTHKNVLTGYSDSSYADNVESFRSTTGFIHIFNGAAIVWKSVCQKTVARSSCEAEYMAMSDATSEIVYLRNLIVDIAPECISAPTVLCVDNKSAIFLGNMTAPTKLSRHIGVRYHNVQQEILNGSVALQHVRSKHQLADILTKNLGPTIFAPLRDLLVR